LDRLDELPRVLDQKSQEHKESSHGGRNEQEKDLGHLIDITFCNGDGDVVLVENPEIAQQSEINDEEKSRKLAHQ
jgi:hypothetical protein